MITKLSSWILAAVLLAACPVAARSLRGIDCQPLVVYDISGFGIAGPIHLHLAVYSDGLTSLSELRIGQSRAEWDYVLVERAYRLVDDLIAFGAMELEDRWEAVSDMPTITVTVFDGNGVNANHNTFSFFDTGGARRGDYEAVLAILDNFVGETFR